MDALKISGSVSGSTSAQSGQTGAFSVTGGGSQTNWTVLGIVAALALLGFGFMVMRRKP